MKFNSIREYFYKLHNALYGLILLPLAAFIFLYLQMQSGRMEPVFGKNEPYDSGILIFSGIIILIDWVLSVIYFNVRLKSIRSIPGFGEKLSEYARLTIVRFMSVVFGLLLLAGSYYLSESQIITGGFVVSLGVLSLLWPLPGKVCKDLKLRGDERLMVLYKKEKLY